MKKKFLLVLLILTTSLVSIYIIFKANNNNIENDIGSVLFTLPESPLNATYRIQETEITLKEGTYKNDSYDIEIQKEPVYGDVNGDNIDDAVLILVENTDIKKYHLAVALKDGDGYLGLVTLPLEREDSPLSVHVEDTHISVSYRPKEQELSHVETEYFTLMENLQLINKTPKNEDTIYTGYYIYGLEIQTFSPCDGNNSYWISPESESIAALKAIYEEKTRDLEERTPIYIVLSGHTTSVSTEDMGESIVINSIISIPEEGECGLIEEEHTSPQ